MFKANSDYRSWNGADCIREFYALCCGNDKNQQNCWLLTEK
jgi:hypothetical protein